SSPSPSPCIAAGAGSAATVRHAYTTSLRALVAPIADFAAGECAYRAARGDAALAGYIDPGPVWRGRRDRDPRVARALAAGALRTLARPGTWRWRGAPTAVAAAARGRLAVALLGPRLERTRRRLGLLRA